MIRSAIENLGGQIRPRMGHKTGKEICEQFRLQIAHMHHIHLLAVDQRRASAQVNSYYRQRLVHRMHKVPGAIDPSPLSQRLRKQLAQHDPRIFHRMMLVHVQIAARRKLQIECAMFRKQLQHVVQEANPGRNLVTSAPFDAQRARYLSLSRISLDPCFSHLSASAAAFTSASSSFTSASTANAPQSRRMPAISSCLGFCRLDTPMNGTPADCALCASSTVSPRYQTVCSGYACRMSRSPSGAGFGFATHSSVISG